MNPASRILPFIFLLLIAAALVLGLFDYHPKEPQISKLVGTKMRHFDIPMLGSDARFTPDLWKGKIAVVIAFASWCPPCGMEHVAVSRLAKNGKAPVYGIAWNDKAEDAAKWLKTRGNPYAAVGVDSGGNTTVPLDLTGVPETFVVDKDGTIVYNFKAAINEQMVDEVILPLIVKLQAQ